MFGLTFWENWSVIGENDASNPAEPPFKFVYYNGRTRQNTYEGAFVYARTPTLAPEAMASVHRIAREAGMVPDNFCKIRNSGFEASAARAGRRAGLVGGARVPRHLRGRGRDDGGRGARASPTAARARARARGGREPAQPRAAAPTIAERVRGVFTEAVEFLEDPHSSADWMFSQQQKVDWSVMPSRR